VRQGVARLHAGEADGVRRIYPIDSSDYEALRDAIEKLRLNDSSFSYEPETVGRARLRLSLRLLGAVHIEITQERLEREFGLELIRRPPRWRTW